MACFVAPATVAVVTTVVRKVVEKREAASTTRPSDAPAPRVSSTWTQRLGWLNLMLWGGTIMLVLDHLLSGELTLQAPFLTALQAPGQVDTVLREILVTGGTMTAAVFVIWAMAVVFVELRSKAKAKLAHEV
jgi:hypothetical protein